MSRLNLKTLRSHQAVGMFSFATSSAWQSHRWGSLADWLKLSHFLFPLGLPFRHKSLTMERFLDISTLYMYGSSVTLLIHDRSSQRFLSGSFATPARSAELRAPPLISYLQSPIEPASV